MDLAKFVAQVEQNRRELERKQRQVVDKFPAVLTAVENGRYAWTEQTWSATGTRYTKPNGRSGTTSYMPAYAYGDGSGPTAVSLPVEVMLRRTVATADFGPVYEFSWNCACEGGYSGSGNPPGDVVFPLCCDGAPVPKNLVLTTIHEGSITCDCAFTSRPLTWVGFNPGDGTHRWTTGPFILCGFAFTANLVCSQTVFGNGDFRWNLGFIQHDDRAGGCVISDSKAPQLYKDEQCSPLFMIWPYMGPSSGPFTCCNDHAFPFFIGTLHGISWIVTES